MSNLATAASFDAIAMYPSISLLIVKKAVQFFSKDLPKKEKKTIEKCLEMIRFSMGNTLIWFRTNNINTAVLSTMTDGNSPSADMRMHGW